ncbi:MAG TPA: methyltransferase [Xanthobacteraceae bacterium]
MAADPAVETTEDAVLGGRLVLRQPRQGHRFGHDAILLAAACSAHPGEHLIDLGAGVGTAGLAVACRVDDLAVTLVDADAALVALARDNAARNGMAGRVSAVHLDVGASAAAFAAAGLQPAMADHVIMNPPFNAPQNPSPHHARRRAHNAAGDTLASWLKAVSKLLRPGGVATVIWRADGLNAVLGEISRGFGAIAVLPIHPKPDVPAIRVLVRAVKSSRAPLSLLPGFFLADQAGKPTADAEAVLRAAAALPMSAI